MNTVHDATMMSKGPMNRLSFSTRPEKQHQSCLLAPIFTPTHTHTHIQSSCCTSQVKTSQNLSGDNCDALKCKSMNSIHTCHHTVHLLACKLYAQTNALTHTHTHTHFICLSWKWQIPVWLIKIGFVVRSELAHEGRPLQRTIKLMTTKKIK